MVAPLTGLAIRCILWYRECNRRCRMTPALHLQHSDMFGGRMLVGGAVLAHALAHAIVLFVPSLSLSLSLSLCTRIGVLPARPHRHPGGGWHRAEGENNSFKGGLPERWIRYATAFPGPHRNSEPARVSFLCVENAVCKDPHRRQHRQHHVHTCTNLCRQRSPKRK